MIYLFAARVLPARALVIADLFGDNFFDLSLLLPDLFFSAPPRLRGEGFSVPPTNAARTHTTGGSPSMIARQDFPSSLDP
jgi:hypothetical protein